MEQRQLKFRAWTGKSMVEFHLHEIDGGSITTADGNDNEDAAYTRIEKLKVMQFTGLLDVQGREIYEGDIVRTNVIEGDEDEPAVYGMTGVVEIAPHGTGFGVYRSDCCERPIIIGNIHEHPHLMSSCN